MFRALVAVAVLLVAPAADGAPIPAAKSLRPSLLAALRELGAGDVEAARARLIRALLVPGPIIDVDEARARVMIGVTYLVRDRYDEAIAELERARALDPHNRDALHVLACVASIQNRIEDALVAVEAAVALGAPASTLADEDLKNLRELPRFRAAQAVAEARASAL